MGDKDIVRLALYDAIDWQTSLADAYGYNSPEKIEALEMAKKYRSILKRRYSVSRTPMEKIGDNSVAVSLYEIREKNEHS